MNKLLSRWLPCLTLFAWGAIFVCAYFSKRLHGDLHPAFRILALLAGCVILAIAVCFLIFPAAAECCTDASCPHPFAKFRFGRLLSFAILLVPICVAAAISPSTYGETTIQNRGIITDAATLNRTASSTGNRAKPAPPAPAAADSGVTSSLTVATPSAAPAQSDNPLDALDHTPEGYAKVQVLDLLYAAQDSGLQKDFAGQKLELIGQMMPDTMNNANGKRFKVVRMFVVCCAADARPVAAMVECDKKPDFPDMTWVRVVGTATFPLENGRNIAVMKAEKVTQVEPPDDAMLYQ